MKLYYTKTSPYSRKVRLVILEKGLDKRVDEILVDPFREDPQLYAVNPLGKVPSLGLDNGETLFDSPVICHYLDGLSEVCPLVPEDGWRRWSALRWEALADGIADAAYNMVMERRRPELEQSASWLGFWSREIQRALDAMEHRVAELDGELTLAQLATGAVIGYLDFRVPELLYEAQRPEVAAFPGLHAWYEAFSTRRSMTETRPGD